MKGALSRTNATCSATLFCSKRKCLLRSVSKVHASPPQWTELKERLDKTLSLLDQEEEKELSEMETTKEATRRGMGVRDIMQLKDGELPRVAIVGRPNVGKSALVNRLTKSSKAIVFDKPGITRDRLMVRAFWMRSEFMLVDTGGLPDTKYVSELDALGSRGDVDIPFGVEKQVAAAVDESDAILFVVDGQEGPVDGDVEILSWLRKRHSTKPIVVAVNKCEFSHTADYKASLFWELGLEPHPVSAVSGLGTGDLLDALVKELPLVRRKEEEELTSIAIIGRPNTGKSSLLNAMVGHDRAIVSKVPGTTRDAIDCRAKLWNGEWVKLVDTAGIRRATAVHGSSEKVEPLMVNRSLRAMRECNIAVLMIDCYEGVRLQDARIIEQAQQEGCGLVVVANKFDLLNHDDWDKPTVKAILKNQLRQADWAHIVVTSLKDENPLKAVSKAILAVDANHSRRLTTSSINMIIQDAVHFRSPPASPNGKRGRVYYSSQVSSRPPTFVLFVNDSALFEETYTKYLEKYLRENIDLSGTPIRIVYRGKTEKKTGSFKKR